MELENGSGRLFPSEENLITLCFPCHSLLHCGECALQYGFGQLFEQAVLPDDILGFLLVGEQSWLINGT